MHVLIEGLGVHCKWAKPLAQRYAEMRKIDARSQKNKQKAPGNRAPHNLQTSSLVPLARRGRQFGVCVCIAHLAEHENGVTGAPAATVLQICAKSTCGPIPPCGPNLGLCVRVATSATGSSIARGIHQRGLAGTAPTRGRERHNVVLCVCVAGRRF